MKLKTIMARERDEWFPISSDELMDANDIEHDAVVAHALTQALAEARNQCHGSWDTCDFIRDRADELMREWGYEE